jgi:erythrocyte band 7 integral membrane protein
LKKKNKKLFEGELDGLPEKQESEYDEPLIVSIKRFFGACFGHLLMFTCCGCCCYPYKSVNMGQQGIIQEFGRIKRKVGEGLHYVNPMTEKLNVVNTKIQVIDLSKQSVITSDNLSVTIDSVVYYEITDIEKSLFKVDDIRHSIIDLSYTTLRNVIGKLKLQECLQNREQIALDIGEIVDEHVHNWGAKIHSIQIKDLIIPEKIMSALSSAATAEREGEAKFIAALADVKSAQAMRDASDILNTEAAMQIRQLETMSKLASSNNAKIVFMPTDLTNLQSQMKSVIATVR